MSMYNYSTVQMVIKRNKSKEFKTYLKTLGGNFSPSSPPQLRGDVFIYRVNIPLDKKEILLDSQLKFL